eukprot:gene19143-21062_t
MRKTLVWLKIVFILILASAVIKCWVVKIQNLPGGASMYKPRELHIRNNLKGFIEIIEDPVWSLSVKIKGKGTAVENTVQVICKTQANDTILDIQVYRKQLQYSPAWNPTRWIEQDLTADIVLRVPQYTIMPASKVFHTSSRATSGLKFKGNANKFKMIIDEYEATQVKKPVDVTDPCYFKCNKACDLGSGICIPCERGYSYQEASDSQETYLCIDINECKLGQHHCKQNTTCHNTIGSYECRCKTGFFAHEHTCKECRKCPAEHYEVSACNSTHDAVCKGCRPSCEAGKYEANPCGISYDRYCKDITENLMRIDLGKMLSPEKVIHGSKLFAAPDTKPYVIADDRMQSAVTNVEFTTNKDKHVTVTRSGRCDVELRITNANVLPTYKDIDSPNLNENAIFETLSGFARVRENYCRYPAPDYFTLSHKLLMNYEGLVSKRVCQRGTTSCPAEVLAGETYAYRTGKSCDSVATQGGIQKKLHCDGYTSLSSAFGLRDSSFRDGSAWRFQTQDCRLLFTSCKSCGEKCQRTSNPTQCHSYCAKLCNWYRKNKCVKLQRHCAKGDLSEFELKSGFDARNNDLTERFNCYLSHDVPSKIFKLQYRYCVKGTNFKGRWRNIDGSNTVNDTYSYDFGVVKARYRLGKYLTKNLLLTGYKSKGLGASPHFEVRPLRASRNNSHRLKVANDNMLRFQLVRPFEISTVNWTDVGNCQKLREWKDLFSADIYKPMSNVTGVTVEKVDGLKPANFYKIKRKTSPTSVDISIPQSTSILREFKTFSKLGNFNATIKSNATVWAVHLRGNVTECPAFLDITMIETTTLATLLRHDVLIMCPLTDFHFFVTIPKMKPIFKERMFVVYVNDGAHTYEARVEKRAELEVVYSMGKRPGKEGAISGHAHLWKKLFPLITLSGCFVVGLMTLMIYARLTKPKSSKKSRNRGYQLAAIQLGDADTVIDKIEKEDRMKNRFMIPIVFLVGVRVAYSFLLTVSVITMIFFAINKESLDVLKDVHEFIATKVKESNRISLALDQFRESEIKFMTDKAAFLECACDYHMGKILANIRENMTAIAQLHDVIAFDQLSLALGRALTTEANRRRDTDTRIMALERRVRNEIKKLEDQLAAYGHRVRHNKWVKAAVFLHMAGRGLSDFEFLTLFGFDSAKFKQLKRKIIEAFVKLRGSLGLSAFIRRLKAPLYPLANILLVPFRVMKARVKAKLKSYLVKLKNKILRNIPCYDGDVDTKNLNKQVEDFEEASKNQCKFSKAQKYAKTILDVWNVVSNISDRYSIKSASGDEVYSIMDGDKIEEEYEKKQTSRLEKLKKVGQFYKPEHTAKAAFAYLKSHSIILVVVFDVLLIVYRNIKTYKFAFMMAAGYEVLRHHKNVTDSSGNLVDGKNRSFARRVIDRFAKSASGMYRVFAKGIKLMFTTLIIPILVVAGAIIALFYLIIAFTSNAMNVQTLDELGAYKLLSSRLDLTENVTKGALKEQEKYLNNYDLGMYKETLKSQTHEFHNMIDDFNAEELIKMERLKAQMCDLESGDKTCDVHVVKLMEKLNVKIKPCVMPIIKARMPNDIYNSKAYRMRLKYDSKKYIDAFRQLVLNTFYLIIGIIGTIVLTIIASKVIFKFLASQGMIRFRNKHVYEEIPQGLKKEYHATVK